MATAILDLVKDDVLVDINKSLKAIFLMFPGYNLGRGIIEVTSNEYKYQYVEFRNSLYQRDTSPYESPLRWERAGKHIVVNFSIGVAFMILTLIIEHRLGLVTMRRFWSWVASLCGCKRSESIETSYSVPAADSDSTAVESQTIGAGEDTELSDAEDNQDNDGLDAAAASELDGDVVDEQKRIASMVAGEDDAAKDSQNLIVSTLRKVYHPRKRKKRKLAVSKVSFAVQQQECFGLLGVNGAGKTTTFKMLTGILQPSLGTAWIKSHDIVTTLKAAQQEMGYCPQFDALCGNMTGRETLTMFARVRGISEADGESAVASLITLMQLDRWADKASKGYSGGNKRKLSVAIALLGQPALLLLDEPSTGMDPRARRFMWDRIKGVLSDERSVVITSHSMEECEAICTRLGIMVNGQLKCIGSPQHLKNKFGKGYTLVVTVRGEQLEGTREFLLNSIPGSEVEEAYDGSVLPLFSLRVPSLTRMGPLHTRGLLTVSASTHF